MILRRYEVAFEPKMTMYGHTLQTPHDLIEPRRFWTMGGAEKYLIEKQQQRFVGGSAGKWVMRRRVP